MPKTNRLNKRLEFNPENSRKIYNLISQIDELKGRWRGGANLSPQVLSRLKKSVIVTSTGASTRIEGANLTDEEVENLLDGIKAQNLKTRDEQEVAGYAELLDNIFNSSLSIRFSESAIKHFHKELLKYSKKDKKHSGEYKFTNNRVEAKDASGKTIAVLFNPTPPPLTPKEMQELTSWTQASLQSNEIHPLIIIGNFILEFLSIHPFQDGNGRLSRVLTNLLLLQKGYEYMPYISHEKLIEDNKKAYYLALRKSQKNWKKDNEDISSWLLFFLNIILEQSKRAIKLFEEESIEVVLSEKQLTVWNYITGKKQVTPKEIRCDLDMPAPTVLQILNKLVKMKKIERLGAGRGVRYRLVE